MKNKFAADMASWEEGRLSLNALKARYPHRDVESITRMHSMLNSAVDETAPDPVAGWNEVRSRMASRRANQAPVSVLARLRPGLQRRLAFGLAAAVMAVPPVALAANSPEVRDSVLDGVDKIFNIDVGTESAVQTTQTDPAQSTSSEQIFSSDKPGDGQSVEDVPGGAAGAVTAKPAPTQQAGSSGPTGSNTVSSASGGDGKPAASGSDGDGAVSVEAPDSTNGADAVSPSPSPSPTPSPLEGEQGKSGDTSTP